MYHCFNVNIYQNCFRLWIPDQDAPALAVHDSFPTIILDFHHRVNTMPTHNPNSIPFASDAITLCEGEVLPCPAPIIKTFFDVVDGGTELDPNAADVAIASPIGFRKTISGGFKALVKPQGKLKPDTDYRIMISSAAFLYYAGNDKHVFRTRAQLEETLPPQMLLLVPAHGATGLFLFLFLKSMAISLIIDIFQMIGCSSLLFIIVVDLHRFAH